MKFPLSRLLLLCLALVVVAGAVITGTSYRVLVSHHERKLKQLGDDSRKSLEELGNLLASPEATADIHAFISGGTLNDLLQPLAGGTVLLGPGSSLTIATLKLQMKDGAPLVELSGTLDLTDSAMKKVEVRGLATLYPPTVENGVFSTRVYVLALEPVWKVSSLRCVLPGFGDKVVTALSQQQLEQMPQIALPVRQTFSIPVQGKSFPVQMKVRQPSNDTLSGTLTTTDFEIESSLELERVAFMDDGIHLFLKMGTSGPAGPPVGEQSWTALPVADRLKTLQQPDVSYFARIHRKAVNGLIQQFTQKPTNVRTVSFASTGLAGKLFESQALDVRLDHPNSLSASARLESLVVTSSTGSALAGVDLTTSIGGRVQVKCDGPGPINPSIGVELTRKNHILNSSIHVTQTPGSAPMISCNLDGPASIRMVFSVGLGIFGNRNIDQRITLPAGKTLFSAVMPSGLQKDVSVALPGQPMISRQLLMSDLALLNTPYGIGLSGRVAVQSAP